MSTKPRNEVCRFTVTFTRLCSVLALLQYSCTTASEDALNVTKVPGSPDCKHADSPHWDDEGNNVYYVDRTGGTINRYHESAGISYSAAIAGFTELAFIVPVYQTNDTYVVGDGFELCIFIWDGVSPGPLTATSTQIVGDGRDYIASGKADASGLLYVSMKQGALYLIAHDKTATEQVPMSGGTFKEIAWDLTNKTLYRGAFFNIVQYAVDPFTAVVTPKSTVFLDFLSQQNPDHFTSLVVCDDGNLWALALNQPYGVFIDARSRTMTKLLDMKNVIMSSMAFGTSELDTMFVTTVKDAAYPKSGGLYQVTGTGTRGIAGVSARINV